MCFFHHGLDQADIFSDAGLLSYSTHQRDVARGLIQYVDLGPESRSCSRWSSRPARGVMDPNNAWQAYYNRFGGQEQGMVGNMVGNPASLLLAHQQLREAANQVRQSHLSNLSK